MLITSLPHLPRNMFIWEINQFIVPCQPHKASALSLACEYPSARERKRERKRDYEKGKSETETENGSETEKVSQREMHHWTEIEKVAYLGCEWERESERLGESVCVCVCVWEREREIERMGDVIKSLTNGTSWASCKLWWYLLCCLKPQTWSPSNRLSSGEAKTNKNSEKDQHFQFIIMTIILSICFSQPLPSCL